METDSTSVIQPELAPDETLVWAGQPRQGFFVNPGETAAIPGYLIWSGFAMFWEYKVLTTAHSPLILKLWGIPFVVIGLYLLIGRFIIDIRRRTNTHYGVTSDRILIVNNSAKVRVVSLDLHTLSGISPTILNDGYGTITFGSHYAPQITSGKSRQRVLNSQLPCFDTISDARTVYELIRSTQKKPELRFLLEARMFHKTRQEVHIANKGF